MSVPLAFLSPKVRPLIADRRGAVLIEFAIVIIPLVALFIAIIQVTLTFFAQQTLETASDKAVRQLMTGTAQKSGITQDQFRALVCSKLPSFMQCSNVLLDVRTANSWASADATRPSVTYDASGNPVTTQSYAPGGPGEITIAKIMYVWNVQGGPLGFDISTMSRNRRLLVATSVFRTEPYS